MFNSSTSSIFKPQITFNSVAGTLVKSNAESRFVRFHMGSRFADSVFDPTRPSLQGKSVVVLQVMLCGGDNFLVEYVYLPKEPL